jgi:hypothetical protein
MANKIMKLKIVIMKKHCVKYIKYCEKYQGNDNLTEKQQHRPMICQNRAEQDLTANTTLREIFLYVQKSPLDGGYLHAPAGLTPPPGTVLPVPVV